ncbi:hypothetical protein VTN02DRAFT_1258 [Thermoascus thermophilus]
MEPPSAPPCARAHPAPRRSRLESLPVELIQKIFLESLELNLPRASIHLARALSDPLIYTWLIRLAGATCRRASWSAAGARWR